jgi:hypothetical protein
VKKWKRIVDLVLAPPRGAVPLRDWDALASDLERWKLAHPIDFKIVHIAHHWTDSDVLDRDHVVRRDFKIVRGKRPLLLLDACLTGARKGPSFWLRYMFPWTVRHVASARVVAEPPPVAEFLLGMCLPSRRVEHVVGDMNERFVRDCERYGVRRAKRLYWSQVLRSVGPLVIRAIGRALKWGVVVEGFRRKFFG